MRGNVFQNKHQLSLKQPDFNYRAQGHLSSVFTAGRQCSNIQPPLVLSSFQTGEPE